MLSLLTVSLLALLRGSAFRIHDGLSDTDHEVVAGICDRLRFVAMGRLHQPHPGVVDDLTRGAERISVGIVGSRHQQTSSRSGVGFRRGGEARLSSGCDASIGRAV
ncbi:hypothetical protein [Methylobacterium oryzisoli]|uniref:hypothetical protein n=1 Tax=Methylobacterium oryzisoli TaxID=3385502 RepID=UPI00389136CA